MASKTDLEESGTGSSTPISTREQQQQPEQQQQQPEQQQPQPGPASSVLPSHAQREPQQSPMGPPPAPVSSAGTSGQNVKAKNNASPSLNSPANPSLSRNHSHNHHHPQHHHIQSQHPFPPLSPTIMAHTGSPSCMPELTTSTVPVRHPRPLTAAELHLELEKEQEAVVNRLTRELSALRAHSASVASTASSNSTGLLADTPNEPSTISPGLLTGSMHPTPSRRHRSSSSLSRTSVNAIAGSNSVSQSSTERTAAAVASLPHRASITGGAAPVGSTIPNAGVGVGAVGQHVRTSSAGVWTTRYEEAALARQELGTVKAENEVLRKKVRELERRLRDCRTSSSTTTNDSSSTTENGRRDAD